MNEDPMNDELRIRKHSGKQSGRRKVLLKSLTITFFLLSFAGCGGQSPSAAPPNPIAPTIVTQPANRTVTAGMTATFMVAASGAAPLSYQWQRNGSNINGATFDKYTTPTTVAADNGAVFRVLVSNSAGSGTSNTAILTVTGLPQPGINVTSYHYDNMRQGQNLNESALTLANVNSARFGKLGFFPVDGKVDAQPLLLSSVFIPGAGTHNILYVATEHGSVYAYDADNTAAPSIYWMTSVLAGESPSDNRGCSQVTPEIGVTSTPVIDRTAGPNGAIYVVAASKDAAGNIHQRLHALDVATGQELFGGPKTIQATYPGSGDGSSGGVVVFDPKQYNERAGLLLVNGTIYTMWASHCDFRPYTSWVIAYDANTLAQTSVLNLVPNGSGGAVWLSGTAPAADDVGNIFVMLGNGDFDTTLNAAQFPSNGNCGNCFVKLSTFGQLTLADYFTPKNTVEASRADQDLGSGGAILLPGMLDATGTTRRLAVGAGKDRVIYVVDREAMGKFDPAQDRIYQEIAGQLTGAEFSMPAYFNGTVYFGPVGDTIKAFSILNGRLALPPASRSATSFGYPGTTPSISASGLTNGILWAVENGTVAVLHAYDATNLATELYNSSIAAGRDQFGEGNKFITPMIANGKVYVGTTNGVAVFGLLP